MAADSTSAQRRRVTKPLMEKKRRARINMCLAELKRMVAEKEGGSDLIEGRSSRLEKADILEMTVRFLRRNHHQVKQLDSPTDLDTLGNYGMPGSSFHEGFKSCIAQVDKFLSSNGSLWPRDESLSSLRLHLRHTLTAMSNASGILTPCSSSKSFCESPSSAILPPVDLIQMFPRGSGRVATMEDNRLIAHLASDLSGIRGFPPHPSGSVPRCDFGEKDFMGNVNPAVNIESQSVWRPWDMSMNRDAR